METEGRQRGTAFLERRQRAPRVQARGLGKPRPKTHSAHKRTQNTTETFPGIFMRPSGSTTLHNSGRLCDLYV